MPRYSLSELITRANAGNIGRRGLRRLEGAGLNPSELGASGVASPLNVDPEKDLAARRAALYGRALEAAHNLQPGQTLDPGYQRRLQLGSGQQGEAFTPRSADQLGSLTQGGDDHYNVLLAALRKRAQGVASGAGIYKF